MRARRDDDERAVRRMAATRAVAERLRASWARQGMADTLIELTLAPVRRA